MGFCFELKTRGGQDSGEAPQESKIQVIKREIPRWHWVDTACLDELSQVLQRNVDQTMDQTGNYLWLLPGCETYKKTLLQHSHHSGQELKVRTSMLSLKKKKKKYCYVGKFFSSNNSY